VLRLEKNRYWRLDDLGGGGGGGTLLQGGDAAKLLSLGGTLRAVEELRREGGKAPEKKDGAGRLNVYPDAGK